MTIKEYVETLTDEQKDVLRNAISLTKKAIEERKKAIENHRDMWNWISDKTLERKIIVNVWDYFRENGIDFDNIPSCECYLCEYGEQYGVYDTKCKYCPLEFTSYVESFRCLNDESPFYKWDSLMAGFDDYKISAKYAKEIAELPETELNELDLLKKFL